MHIDQPRHDEMPGMVDQPVGFRTTWRTGLGADIGEAAFAVEDQHAACLRLVLPPGEQATATHESVHRRASVSGARTRIYSISVADA